MDKQVSAGTIDKLARTPTYILKSGIFLAYTKIHQQYGPTKMLGALAETPSSIRVGPYCKY